MALIEKINKSTSPEEVLQKIFSELKLENEVAKDLNYSIIPEKLLECYKNELFIKDNVDNLVTFIKNNLINYTFNIDNQL